jgi:hypothetical protein
MRDNHEITIAGIAGAIIIALLAGAYSWPSRTGTTALGVVIEDTAGNAITSFGGGGSSGSTFGAAFPATGTAVGFKNGANLQPGTVDASGNLNVNIGASSASVPVTGTFWPATQPVSGTFWQATQPVSGTFWQATQPVSGTVAATQSGTWTVQPGNTANTTPWLVTGAGQTFPVTGTVTTSPPSNASTNIAQYGGSAVVTGIGAAGAGVPRVTVSSDSFFSANVFQWGGASTVSGGVAGSVGIGGIATSGSAVSGNPTLNGGRAQNAEPTAVTNGTAIADARDLVGKQITSPHANKENFISGVSALITTATNTQIIAAQAAGIKIYITAIQCHNSGATGSLLTITSGSGGTALWRAWNAPTSSTPPMVFPTPISTAAATGLFVTTGAASTSQGCTATGYIGT